MGSGAYRQREVSNENHEPAGMVGEGRVSRDYFRVPVGASWKTRVIGRFPKNGKPWKKAKNDHMRLSSEKLIAMTLALGNRADIAIVGVGAIRQGHSGRIFHSFEDAAVARELQEKGVVGHICGHHIDMHGNHVRTSLCERTISIDFERFRDIPLVIGVAWETWRARALHACLVGGLMSALATNQGMAELLLDMD